jgi:tetratricopeptide (TPR) repeat protein
METTRIIEQYLDGTLQYEEKLVLEERAVLDKDFRELIRIHKEVNESIRDNDLSAFQTVMKKVSAEHFHTTTLFSMKRFLRLAAILVIVAGGGVILKYSLFRHVGAEELYQQYYAAYDADMVSRSAQTDKVALDSAIISYSRQDYAEALKILNSIIEHDQKSYLAWFYRGLTCLGTDETVNAIQSFKEIPVSWKSPFNEHRDWYLALALLHHGETAEAAKVFDRINTADGYYAGRADKILQKLKP